MDRSTFNQLDRFEISELDIVSSSHNQTSCELEGESVILNVKDGLYYGLNDVGARVWELLQEPRRVREIYQVLLDEYDVEPGVCSLELYRLLEHLRQRELIEVRDETRT